MRILLILLCMIMSGCGSMNTSTQYFPSPYTQGTGQITFTDLPVSCTIEIYTSSGARVAALTENNGDGEYIWDIKNDSGEKVTPGIYVCILKTGSDQKTGKLVIK